MNNKKKFVMFGLIAILLLTTAVFATSYHFPSKYKGLNKGVDKATALSKVKSGPCSAFCSSSWQIVVGDKATKKAYSCVGGVPSTVKKEQAVCFMSMATARKVGYREEKRRY